MPTFCWHNRTAPAQIDGVIKPMNVRRMLLVLATLTLSPAFNAQANAGTAAWTPPGPTVCRFSGWTVNDNSAIAVRAEASATARWSAACRRRAASLDPALDYYSVTFDLVEARDGWLKIKGASDEMSEKPGRCARRGMDRGRGHAGRRAVGARLCASRRRQRLLDLKGDWLRDGSRCAASSPATVSGCCWTTRCATTRKLGRWRRRTASGGGRGSVASAGPRRPVATCARSTRSGRPRAGSRRLFMPPLRRGPAA